MLPLTLPCTSTLTHRLCLSMRRLCDEVGEVEGHADRWRRYASESFDRTTLTDAFSDELVKNVAALHNNTIVVIHSAGIRVVDVSTHSRPQAQRRTTLMLDCRSGSTILT